MEKKKIELKLYNTMSQQKEIFKPITPGKIGMSFCLITADDISHLGHARAAVCFDILYRFLRHLNYEVDLVRNVTHLDDKLIEKTKESDENPLDFSSCFYASYLKDMDVLQCLGSNNQPRLRDHREQIVKMIEKIIAKGFGYEVGGDVFLSVDKSPNYGQLSGQLLDHTRAAKCDDTDFALWQAAKLGEPSWNSPWGAGRPGWHIECSAMSAHYMSPNFDIHGGGPDLKLPHHEIVIAKACAACEGSRVNCWLQNGHVPNNDVKMGKPLDKFTIRDITDKYHPLALRHFLISAHYLSPLSYSVFQLERSSDFLCSVYQTLEDLNEAVSPHLEDGGEAGEISNSAKKKASKLAKKTSRANLIENMMGDFEAKMSEDLNTSHIHGHAFQEVMSYISRSVTKIKKCQTNQLSLVKPLVKVENAVKEVLQLLGLLTTLSYTEFLKEMKQMALAREKLGAEEVLRCQIDLKTINGTVVHQFEHRCLELVEFVTPQDNVVRYVRKRIGESEHRAKGEFEIMSKLRGKPGVVQCVGTSVHVWESKVSKVYGFLMEFAVGGSLEAKIKMHPEGLPLAIVSKFTHMILLGLQSIHKAGYVHGDLHPGNILLFPREGEELEEAKVSDFGLSKRVNDISWWRNSDKFLGYPAYMSPESVCCGTLERAHDIWAVGCLVLEMCTSRQPYKGYSVGKIEKELSELVAPKIPNTLSTAAMDFMKVCLATNPKERGTVAQLLEHQFVVARWPEKSSSPAQIDCRDIFLFSSIITISTRLSYTRSIQT